MQKFPETLFSEGTKKKLVQESNTLQSTTVIYVSVIFTVVQAPNLVRHAGHLAKSLEVKMHYSTQTCQTKSLYRKKL